MEPRPPRGEPYENRDGPIRLGARLREQPIRDFALHHHAPALQRRSMLERLHDERRRDVVREVRDELRRRRTKSLDIEVECIAPVQPDVRAGAEYVPENRLEGAIELHRVDDSNAIGEIAGENAEARSDLEHDVVVAELGEAADDSQDVLIDEEVLAESFF